jgi:hypothetical protein
LLKDLVKRYNLPLNQSGRLDVDNHFELEQMLNGQGRMYAAGTITFGGSYAPVDSFLGLQYAALQSVDNLASVGAPGVKSLNVLSSFIQWLKWVFNESP